MKRGLSNAFFFVVVSFVFVVCLVLAPFLPRDYDTE